MAQVADRKASVESALAAELRYVRDDRAGMSRHRAGRGFVYRAADGRPVRDAATLARIRGLVIPPAWTDVWIAPDPRAHLQATGRDARGRKQYRYHPRWRDTRSQSKYERMLAFAKALPVIRQRAAADAQSAPLSRHQVLGTVVLLLERALIRVGNDEYARTNGSFGLTTLRDRHAKVRGTRVTFRFRGKSGVHQHVDVHDAALARSVKRCQDLPGQTLFQYLDADGSRCSVDSGDVNAYLREVAGQDFTAKDFRTWAGTVLAACALSEAGVPASATARKKCVAAAIAQVAARLGNTRAVCRACYVHPAIVDAYSGGFAITLARRVPAHGPFGRRNLSREEAAVVALLRKRAVLPQAA